MAIYENYARVYDQSGQLAFSLRMIGYINRLLMQHALHGRVLCDLACGTGTFAIAMAGNGWQTFGIDGSQEMLDQGHIKAQEQGVQVSWSQQDMRSFTLPTQADMITCLYDSLNYMLTSEDLESVFAQAYRALRPGGLFLFDMNTAYVMSTVWNDETYLTESDDLSVVMSSRYDERQQRATVTLLCFERVGDLYRKIIEEHTEQAYPREHVATLLTDVGFKIEAYYDCFSLRPPDEETTRIMWVARHP